MYNHNLRSRKYFNRFELKYLISLKTRDNIIKYITPLMKLDPHIKYYNYEVRSLYFDSFFGNFYFDKIDGLKQRVKLRVRFYPDQKKSNDELAFIEIKKKNNENVIKQRIIVPLNEVFQIIDANSQKAKDFYNNATLYEKKILNEIWYLKRKYHLHPISIVIYQRQAFQSKMEKTFRVTFDSKIKARNFNFNLKEKGGTKFIVPQNLIIMELKFNSVIPNWALNILQVNDCIHEKISKYALGLNKIHTFRLI
ncbi:MAG: VTC domain-containing protein [Promethearchaeota archaeon]